MRREELFMDILGGLDEKYVALAMPRSCGHSTTDDTHTATAIESVELDGKITTKDRILYWVTHSLGVAAAAFLIIGAAVLLIMNWDKIAVREPDRPGVITTISEPVVTSDSTITEPDKYDPFLYYSDMDMPEPFAQPDITELYYGGTDGWHDEFYDLWKNDFYRIDDYLQKYVGEERAMEVISGYKAEQLADNQAGNITRYRIDDTQNWYRFAMDTGLTANDVRRARQMADENWSESPASMVQEDIFVTFGSKEKIAENNKTEYCISVGEYVFSPRWLYYHTAEDYKAAGITPRMINDMLEKYKTLGLTDEAWIAFRDKLNGYISGEKDNTAVTTSAVTESNGTTAVAVTCETTTSDVIGGTTVISDTDSSADTTVPADDRPTDDELKDLVEQGAEACGLKITVSDITKASLKLNYYCEGDNSKYLAFMWGGKYEIQILSGNEWMTYDPDNFRRWNDEQMWFDSSFSINEFPDHSDEHETILFYGDNMYESEIPKGNYRVLKQIAVYGNGKNLGQLTAYAEFTIDEHTPNVFGITMTAKNVSPESVTLAVQQSGASFHVKRNLGYEARFVLESKTGSGEWKKVDGNPVTWAPDIEPINENGVTEIKEDFSDIYGSLSDGTYRISKQFVNYVGNGETKDDIINSSTYYCEFVIGEKTHDWGITMSAKDVTPAGMTLLIDQKGGNATGEVTYGEQYRLEIKSDEFGTWEKLGYITDEINWTDIGYILEPGAHNENQINWTYIYGYLPAGH